MSAAALRAILSTVGSFVDNPLVSRLLQNLSHWTRNKIDDKVIDAFTSSIEAGDPPPTVENKLAGVQAEFDAMTPEQLEEARELQPMFAGGTGPA